jgi:hypothetical protein
VDGRYRLFSYLGGVSKVYLMLISSALSLETKDWIKMEYGWLERANLLWKVLEQMYG